MLNPTSRQSTLQVDIHSPDVDWCDNDVARALVEKLRPRLLREIDRQMGVYLRRRFDEEDILQSVFASFIRMTKSGEYEFDHTGALAKFLQTIMENKVRRAAVRHTRQKRDVRRVVPTDVSELNLADEDWDPKQWGVETLVEQVAAIVDTLPERDAEFFRRRHFEGHSVGKIANDTRWCTSTVRRVLDSVYQRIRERLDDSG